MKHGQLFLFTCIILILTFSLSSFGKGGKKEFAGYKKSADNTYFLQHKKGTGIIPVDTGGAVFVKMQFKTPADSVFLDINKATNSPTYPIRIDKPLFKGDFLDFLLKLHVGDSVSFFVSMDSLKKYYPKDFHFEPKYEALKYLGFAVKVDSIYSKVKVAAFQAAAEKEMELQQAEQKKKQEEQQKLMAIMKPIYDSAKLKEPMLKENDFMLLSDYIKTKWKGTKNPDNDGIFYLELAAGVGEALKSGTVVNVRYTGKYLDGTTFDSNNLFPQQPLMPFKLDDDRMIQGFNACVSKMKIGTKSIFILPPRMGYSDGLTRIFEVELVSANTN